MNAVMNCQLGQLGSAAALQLTLSSRPYPQYRPAPRPTKGR